MGNENSKAVPTQDEYIAEQIAIRKADALKKSLSRTKPRVPQGIKTGERWNSVTKKVEDIYELGPSCAYTFSDNYGLNWMGSEDFRQNHANYGWKQVPWEQRQPGNAVLIVDDEGVAKHTMMYDSDNAQGQPLFNHSNGGHDESAIRKKAKYPHHNPYLAYEFVGTPADSTLWINQYKQIYGMAKGGVFGIPKYLGGTPEGGDEKSTNELSLDKETKARSDRYSKKTKVEAATIRRSQNHNGKLFQSYQGNYNLNTTPQNDTTFIYNIPNIHFQYNSDGVTGRKSYLYQDKKKGIIKHGITYDGTLPEDVLKYKLFGLDLLKITQNNKVSFKKGGGIYIKKKNRGKFREYCGGEVTDECILKAKKSKNPKLRKRATFALNSRSWSKKHEEGAKIHKPYGHRSILDNGWLSTKELKKKNRPLISINATGGPLENESPSRNWDRTLTGKLINFSENPDSIGWDAKNRRWYAPPAGKGYDTNLFGMGVDRNQTPGFKERVKRDNKGREYLTVDDERYLRHMAIDRANESANTRYKFAQKASKIKGAVSPKHDAITVSAIYNLGPGHMARTVFENSKAMKSIFNRNSSEYQNHIHKLYKLKGRNERIQNELKFFKLNGL